jgi:hypothetical protein
MSNEMGNTQLSAVIPEVWRPIILDARYSTSISDRVCYTEFPEIKNKGDTVHLAVFPRLSVNAVGSGGSVTRQQLTLTDNSISIAQYFECTVDIEDLSGFQGLMGDSATFAKKWAAQFAPRLTEKQDNYIFALTGFSNTALGGAGEHSAALIRQGLASLDKVRVPKSGRAHVMGVQAYYELFSDQQFVNAHQTGLMRGAQISGFQSIPTVYGIRYEESQEVAVTGGLLQNWLVHEEAVASVTQKNPSIVPLAKVQLSSAITGAILFDGKVIRPDHGVILQSTQS